MKIIEVFLIPSHTGIVSFDVLHIVSTDKGDQEWTSWNEKHQIIESYIYSISISISILVLMSLSRMKQFIDWKMFTIKLVSIKGRVNSKKKKVQNFLNLGPDPPTPKSSERPKIIFFTMYHNSSIYAKKNLIL